VTPLHKLSFRSTRVVAALAVPTLTLGLIAGSASAAGGDAFFVGANTGPGAVVTSSTGASHTLISRLRAISADGSVNVLSAMVTPARAATVLVHGTTGTGRIIDVDPADGSTQLYAGDGAVLARKGDSFTAIDPVTGARAGLAKVPDATDGTTRTVVAVNAVSGGALVATADVTPAGTSGEVRSSSIWRLTAGGAEQLVSLTDQYVVAVAARPGGIDAVLVSLDGDVMSRLFKGEGAPVVKSMGIVVSPEVDYVELAYAVNGGTLVPVVSVVAGGATTVYDANGQVLDHSDGNKRLFLSAGDINDPQRVSNRLLTKVSLSGVPGGAVLRYGAKLIPMASASAWSNEVPVSHAPATLTVATGKKVTTGVSGRKVTLTHDTCFTASAAATLYARAAKPETKCVEVAHRLVLDSFNARRRVAVVNTSANAVLVQVQQRNGKWETVRRVKAVDHRVKVTVPRGKVRMVAEGDAANAAATLLVAKA